MVKPPWRSAACPGPTNPPLQTSPCALNGTRLFLHPGCVLVGGMRAKVEALKATGHWFIDTEAGCSDRAAEPLPAAGWAQGGRSGGGGREGDGRSAEGRQLLACKPLVWRRPEAEGGAGPCGGMAFCGRWEGRVSGFGPLP